MSDKPTLAEHTDQKEPDRMLTIRLPESMHTAVVLAAKEANLSINKFCIRALGFDVVEDPKPRGRKSDKAK